jgi:hypothetical protein
LFILCAAVPAAAQPQDADGGVEILKVGWTKERIAPRPSQLPLAGREELILQSQREAQLAAARNAANRGAASRVETQIQNHAEATARARQTPPPKDAYRYTVKLRNNGVKTVKSIDWDYLFINPTDQTEVARHQFTSDETIKPTRSKEIGVLYLVPPVKTVSASMLGGKKPLPYVERVVLMRIQYSDGSVWQRP